MNTLINKAVFRSRNAARNKCVINPRNTAKDISNHIIASMQKGVDGWQTGWMNGYDNGMDHLLPKNVSTGKSYNDINRLILSIAMRDRRYKENKWITYRQAQKEGWNVARGEKGTLLTFYGVGHNREELSKHKGEYYRFLREYTVFNVAQLEGYSVKPDAAPKLMYAGHNRMIGRIIANTDVTILPESGKEAIYIRSRDAVQMLPREAFTSSSGYKNTLINTLIQATSAAHRCDRDYKKTYGSEEAHARESLVVELTAAFLYAEIDCISEALDNRENNINKWVRLLSSDDQAIFKACEDAQQAADFIIYEWASEKKEAKTA